MQIACGRSVSNSFLPGEVHLFLRWPPRQHSDIGHAGGLIPTPGKDIRRPRFIRRRAREWRRPGMLTREPMLSRDESLDGRSSSVGRSTLPGACRTEGYSTVPSPFSMGGMISRDSGHRLVDRLAAYLDKLPQEPVYRPLPAEVRRELERMEITSTSGAGGNYAAIYIERAVTRWLTRLAASPASSSSVDRASLARKQAEP
jgi:hypothetical protein